MLLSTRKLAVIRRQFQESQKIYEDILPNWRVEATTNPFSIKYFRGWFRGTALFFWLLGPLILVFVAFGLFIVLMLSHNWNEALINDFVIGLLFLFILLVVHFRSLFFEQHENWILFIVKKISIFLNVELEHDFESVIYKAKSVLRGKSTFKLPDRAVKMLIEMEDETFPTHHGVSLRGIIRALRSLFRKGKKVGGSTITQQLVRSLFIRDYSKILRRKLLEILLAFWAETVFDKRTILNMYVTNVRFDFHIFGIVSAKNLYFGEHITLPTLSNDQWFILFERIGNINRKIRVDRIRMLLKRLINKRILSEADKTEIEATYAVLANEGKLIS